MMAKGLYRGYSSHEYQPHQTFSIRDIELVKLDLLNHIFTRRGERVMMPAFGTRIPDLAFEPLDPITLSILEEDLRFVVNFDPRVSLVSMVVTPLYDSNTVTAAVKLLYVELNMVDTLDLNITFEGSA
jgi:phage baseplate assembly protein W